MRSHGTLERAKDAQYAGLGAGQFDPMPPDASRGMVAE
jgi:hypothetical protein